MNFVLGGPSVDEQTRGYQTSADWLKEYSVLRLPLSASLCPYAFRIHVRGCPRRDHADEAAYSETKECQSGDVGCEVVRFLEDLRYGRE